MSVRATTGPAEATDRRVWEILRFVRRYVACTPELFDSILAAADSDGVLTDVLTLLAAADEATARGHDFIPDHLGLVGMVDNAYILQTLVQRLSDDHRERTGVALVSVDLAPASALMRRLIGEPVATALEGIARDILQLPPVLAARASLATNAARLRLRMPQPYETYPQDGDDLDLNLGAAGLNQQAPSALGPAPRPAPGN